MLNNNCSEEFQASFKPVPDEEQSYELEFGGAGKNAIDILKGKEKTSGQNEGQNLEQNSGITFIGK